MLHDWYSANLFFLDIYKISRQKQYFSQCHLTISKHSNHRALQRTGFIKTEAKGRLVTAHLSESQGPSKAEVSLAVTSDGLKRARETMLRARAPSRKKSQLGSPRPFEPAWSMLALSPPPPSRAPPHPSHTLAASYSPFPCIGGGMLAGHQGKRGAPVIWTRGPRTSQERSRELWSQLFALGWKTSIWPLLKDPNKARTWDPRGKPFFFSFFFNERNAEMQWLKL